MKLCLTIALGLLVGAIQAQLDLSAEQWQEDLHFLQKTIHDDYSFLFKKTTAEAFDSAVAALHTAIPDLAEHEIVVGLARTVALFAYGHTSISLNNWRHREKYPIDQMAYHLVEFEDGIFVQGTKEEYAEALGAKVVKVAGMPVDEALATVKPAFPAENASFFRAYGMSYLGNAYILHAQGVTEKLQETITLTLEKDGKVFEETFASRTGEEESPTKYAFVQEKGLWLDARDNSTDPLYLKNLDRIYYYEYLPEYNAVYVRHSQIQDDPEEDIPAFYDRVFEFIEEKAVDKMILDVRLNGGGNNYKNKPIVTGVIKSRINVPGKFFVLISGRTYSACQNLVNELDNYTEAVFIGTPTGENINFYGDNNTVILPNSELPIRLSFAWWQDKPQWENAPWLAPHLAVDMTFAEYASNKDPLLTAALEFADDSYILDPMGYLTELYQSGQQEKLQAEAVRMINDPLYAYFDFESEFNSLGYRVLNSGDSETAVVVFQFAANLFPESPNVWDSLAEGLWRSGDTEKAKEYYRKAIAMDPDGYIGNNAKTMLRKIEAGDR